MNFPLMTAMMSILLFTYYPKNATVYGTAKGEKKQALKRGLKGFADSIWKRPRVKAPENSETAEQLAAIFMKELSSDKRQRWDEHPEHGMHSKSRQAALKEIKCISRSCPAIGIPFGSLYMIKRSTVLNLFNFIACNTISMLLTYP